MYQNTEFIALTELQELRAKLPPKSIKLISERTGYTEAMVRYILSGARRINIENVVIITEARKIIHEFTNQLKQ